MIDDENYKKMTDAVKANMFSAGDLNLSENAMMVFKNSGVSMESFKIRQDVVDILHAKHPSYNFAKFDRDDQQLASMFDQFVRLQLKERIKKMNEQAIEQFHSAMASLPHSKILPVIMMVGGEEKVIGQALVDPTEAGFCIVHAIVDGQENVAELLKDDPNRISIGKMADFRKKED